MTAKENYLHIQKKTNIAVVVHNVGPNAQPELDIISRTNQEAKDLR